MPGLSTACATLRARRRDRRGSDGGDEVPTTAGTNIGGSGVGSLMSGCRARRRHVNSCWGINPCRRATSDTTAPGASVSSTIRALSSAEKQLNTVQTSLGKLAGGFALGTLAVDGLRTGFRILSGVVTESIKEFEQQQAAVAQLNAVLQSTKNAAGLTAKEVVALADSLSQASLFSDDMVLSAENMLLTFTNITRDIFPETIQTVLDMSAALGQDLKSSAIQLGKALNDPLQGVSALQRVGVSFNNTQQETIEKLVKSGQTMEAQRLILAELAKEFGGSAKSAYEAASSVTKLQKNIAELKEDIGSGLTPALNNVFSAFQSVTSGMGKNVETGKVVFKTFGAIAEFAANTATGIHALAGTIVTLGSYVVQVGSVIGVVTKDGRENFKLFRESVSEGIDTTADFALTLRNKNEEVLRSWGELTQEARVFGNVGPAAYQATAKEAEAAQKKVEDTQKAISATERDLESLQKALLSDDQAAARAFAEQEQKVSDLRKQASEETDPTRRAELMSQIGKEQTALDSARPQFRGAMSTMLDQERTRAGLTDFERTLQDVQARKMERITTDLPQILLSINFNDVVAGDKGIVEIIQRTVQTLNRNTTLSSVAGA